MTKTRRRRRTMLLSVLVLAQLLVALQEPPPSFAQRSLPDAMVKATHDYRAGLMSIHLLLGLHITYALPGGEGFSPIQFGPKDPPTLPPLTDETLQSLQALRERLLRNDRPKLGVPAPDEAIELNVALSAGHDVLRRALRAITAYERSYDAPSNRRLRLAARAANCSFLHGLYEVLYVTPKIHVEAHSLDQSWLDAFYKRGGLTLDMVPAARDWVCRQLPESTAGQSEPRSITRTGTGFVVADGRLVTAFHVIQNATAIEVTCPHQTPEPAVVEKVSGSTDLAVLRVVNLRLSTRLSLAADSFSVQVGHYAFTVGFPAPEMLGAEPKFTEGSISALSGPNRDETYFQVSLPIQPGNSGGPLLNVRGEVVGVVVATANARAFLDVTGALPQNVNWAIKGSYVRALLGNAPTASLARSKDEAVDRALRATCLVTAREASPTER